MSVTEIVAWTVSIIALMYLVLIYNNLVQLKYNVAKAWANIDVLLKQRHDELPQLVAVCKQYMRHERDALEQLVKVRAEVSSARNLVNLKEFGMAEQQMRDVLNHLFALAENYPDLKADALFNHLQVRIARLENAIADRRELCTTTPSICSAYASIIPRLSSRGCSVSGRASCSGSARASSGTST
ncbi:LemA family protein [Rhodanobacter lindaniclasticus]